MKTPYELLEEFIYEHKNWRELLAAPPYSINIKNDCAEHPTWYLFKYNQLNTDFSYELCKACRGVVLDIKQEENAPVSRIFPVCVPYVKFFNFSEPYSEQIDWLNHDTFVELKYDGNLIKLSKYEGKIHWFTNGSMSTNVKFGEVIANDAIVDKEVEPETKHCKTFQDLIDYAVRKVNAQDWVENIPEGITFMFELIGPRNRIIVPYEETNLVLHGIYHHELTDPSTWHEQLVYDYFETPFYVPKIYHCKTIDETIAMLKDWKGDKEGIVVCELPSFKRVKIKSDFYKSLKFVKGETGFTPKHIFEAIQNESIDDAIAAFPDIKEKVDEVKKEISEIDDFIFAIYQDAISLKGECANKKEFALKIKDLPYKSLMFEAYDGKRETIDNLKTMSYEKFQKLVSLKNEYFTKR